MDQYVNELNYIFKYQFKYLSFFIRSKIEEKKDKKNIKKIEEMDTKWIVWKNRNMKKKSRKISLRLFGQVKESENK